MEPVHRAEALNGDRPISSLFRQLTEDIGRLVRQESELARAELSAKGSQLAVSAAVIGAGALVGLAAFLCLLFAAALALGVALGSMIAGALVTGVVTLAVAIALVAMGRARLRAEELAPKRTIESLRRDVETLKPGTH
jgi:hypothetical protein